MKLRIKTRPFITLVLVTVCITALYLYCGRNNPLDAKSGTYIPGKKPTAQFSETRVSGYIGDSVTLSIRCTDTAAGGRSGAMDKIYLAWKNTHLFDDSIPGSAVMEYVYKNVFPAGTWTVRVKAVDREGRWSDGDSALLTVLLSEPKIDSVRFRATVEADFVDTFTVFASDIGGTVRTFLWSVDGVAFDNSSRVSIFTVSFRDTGSKNILVKVRDDKNIESPVFTARITVYEKIDTAGPVLSYVNVKDNDTVGYGKLTVYVDARDESLVSGVSVNGVVLQSSAGLWKSDIPLATGVNTLVASAVDGRGNKSEKRVIIYSFPDKNDSLPPVLLLKSPAHAIDTVGISPFTIKVTAIDVSGIKRVTTDGRDMVIDTADAAYGITVDLQQGKNLFAISSTDLKGNTGIDTLIVFYEPARADKTPPLIAIAEPLNDRHISDTVVVVQGTATDENHIASVLVNGMETMRSYPSWKATAVLHYGYDTIRVKAIDSSVSRNWASDSVIVVQNVPARFSTTSSQLDTAIPVGQLYTATVTAIHPENDRITFRLLAPSVQSDSLPIVTANGKTATITYRPTRAGIDTLSLEVKDIWNDGDTLRWRVTVVP